MSLFMLDTNTVSFGLRGNTEIDLQLRSLAPSDWCISAITCAELLYGVERRPAATKLRRLVEGFLQIARVAPWDQLAAIQHARVRHQLKLQGAPIGDFDEMIAGHALSMGAVLVTDNLRHFDRVEGLALENWLRRP
ncbi:MAG: type II toxin-antitoxin system VapC family toxin [Proteobacteria bacterium]|nr:type II toxin-antitoxin system VapC family toxin [Pseudomonadota bacterium]